MIGISKLPAIVVATAIGAIILMPLNASARDDDVVPNIIAAPLAIAAAPFIAADELLFGGSTYYAPGPRYAYAGPTPLLGEPDWISYCSAKYRSFNPATGTYLGYDGIRHYCH